MKNRIIQALLCLTLLIGLSACKATLEPGGAYSPVDTNGVATVQPDYAFYVADAAFNIAAGTVDAAFKFESDNRPFLWRASPQIKRELDKVRPQATAAMLQWAKARQAYMLNPVPANLSTLNTVLAKMQQISGAVSAVLPK